MTGIPLSKRKNLASGSFRQLIEYGASVAVTMGANLLLVLILARLLPPEVYAGFVLTKASLLVIASLASLGVSQAVVRHRGDSASQEPVLPTALLGVALLAIPGSLLLIFVYAVLGERTASAHGPATLAATAGAMLAYMLATEVINWMRANHRSRAHAIQSFLRAGLQLALIALAVDNLKSPIGYIFGLLLADVIFLAVVAVAWRGEWRRQARRPDLALLGRMIRYGAPHATIISLGFLLNSADRFMLSYMVADQRLIAYYDVAYMIAASALALLVRPYNLFLFPAYTRRFHEQGAEASIELIEKSITRFLLGAFLITFLITIARVPILTLLFPAGYQQGASIFTPVSIGMLLSGVFMGAAGGLYLSDRTWMVGIASVFAFAINIGANYVLIPILGIDGAAYSTLLAYLVQLAFAHYYGRRYLKVRLPVGLLILGTILCFLAQYLTESAITP